MIAVLGAGVSGMAMARQLALKGHRVVCFEAKEQVGGWVSTMRTPIIHKEEEREIGGVLFESGPHSLRPRTEGNGLRMVQLLCDLKLDKQALLSQGNDRYVYWNGRLLRLPKSLREVMRNPLTKRIPWNLAKDFFSFGRQSHDDETIGSFMQRKLGREAKPLFVAMVGGIFAGNVDNLSVKSCFPQLVEYDKSGSLVRGMLMQNRTKSSKPIEDESMLRLCKASSISFPNGMQTLVDSLKRECLALGVEFRLDNPVQSLSYTSNKWQVNTQTNEQFSHIVSTLQPRALAGILLTHETSHRALMKLAKHIDSVNVAVVNLSYHSEDIPLLPSNSFGHLIADVKLQAETGCLGVLYDSSAFPAQQPKGMVVVSVMLGGAQAKWVSKNSTERELVALARQVLKSQLFITEVPVESHAVLHYDCIPQYQLDHSTAREEALSTVRTEFNDTLLVLGTGVLGVGLSDSIGGGLLAVESRIIS